ncbi:DUF3488 and transglutaminase-like domain-containing protein [Cellulomonas chengniuliangii]|uniref:DUF3488 and transglutaminase-like domain-containing protein n=1 Tax=Cellulomonas chengniuliangii TaxID=2968084 RepID=A0ABY5KV86_9CELL|nr:DUF3488 and transglutaminase-like domain-containing protein [Cellulomonas chengniuliangii]UUI74129.1 DUF3488 and transglutaminase-like domain-containing protein [Cellulomonas chengniuliangii]
MKAPREQRVVLRGARGALGSALVATAVGGCLLAVQPLIAPGPWLAAALAVVVLLALVTASARAVTRRRWAPTLVGALITAAGVLMYFGAPAGRVELVPDAGFVERLVAMTRIAFDLINASVIPMQASRPIVLLVVVGAAVLFLAADLVALGLGAPAWSALVLLTVWIPGIVLGAPASAPAIAITAIAYLLLLALSAAPADVSLGAGQRAGWSVAAAGGLVAMALAAGPLISSAPGWATLQLPQSGSHAAGPVRLDDSLDMRDSLGPRSEQVVLRYTVEGTADGSSLSDAATRADAQSIGPLRAFTLRDFDGRTWEHSGSDDPHPWERGELLTPDPALRGEVPDASAGLLAEVNVDVEGLRDSRLPVSTFARTVEIDGPWLYDDEQDEVVGERTTRRDTTYAMTVQIPDLTAADLRASAPGDAAEVEPYLAVPPTDHAQDVANLAREITAGASGAYEQAMALQSWFRDPRNFVYDTRVDAATSADSVWDFLQSKRGYCVQYATSMAIMARTLGVPARVGVGFLPGTPGNAGEYVVTGRQSHAWPELYFTDVGWVRFEPTPAVQTGSPPRWSDPLVAAPAPSVPAPAEPVAPAGPVPTASGAPAAPSQAVPEPDVDEAEIPRALTAPLAGIALALLLGIVVLVRRRTARVAQLSAEDAWEWLRGRLRRERITWSDAQTPRQVAALVRERAAEVRGEPLGPEADAALTRLADAVESDRYAPYPSPLSPDEVRGWARMVLEGVTAPAGDPADPVDAGAAQQ